MNIYGIILAAGEGKRACGNKLSRHVMGRPMLQWVVEKAVRSRLKHSIMVTGKEKEFGENIARLYGINTVYNPDFKEGMSTSLIKGVQSLPQDADGFAVILGDMPFIRTETINLLLERFSQWPEIVIPLFRGKRGHPPIFSVKYRDAVLAVTGDRGARDIIKRHSGKVLYIEVDDPGTIKDVDYFTR